ncbi:MAG: choice-of-anchor Q domain-containing protein, partial [Chloroflexota bacterium]
MANANEAETAAPSNNIYYVNQAVSGGAGDGSSWANAYVSLQDALGVATNGDEIWVAAGVYYPDDGLVQVNDDPAATFLLTDGLKLYGGFAGTEAQLVERDWETNITALSGDIDENDETDANGLVTHPDYITGTNSYHVVTTSDLTKTTAIDGFAITGGSAGNYPSPYIGEGGGLYNDQGQPQLANILFIGNQALEKGGAMYSNGSGSIDDVVSLTNVSFINNRVKADIVTFGPPRAPQNTDYQGGALYVYYATLTLTDVDFINNETDGGTVANDYLYAGALYFKNGYFDMDGGRVIGNHADTRYGAFELIASGNDSSIQVKNTLFTENTSGEEASALHISTYSHPVTITNNTVAGNWSQGDGHAVELSGSSANKGITVENNIIWGNFSGSENISETASIEIESDITPTLSSNIIAGSLGSGANWNISQAIDGGGNLDVDPDFILPITTTMIPTDTGVFLLKSTSPAIGAAKSASCPAKDVLGSGRLGDGLCDIGAYEYQSTHLWTVNSTADGSDILPGDGLCDTDLYRLDEQCTLRAAIDESNTIASHGEIVLPAGTFAISLEGFQEDNNKTGDFDILDDLTITGAGQESTFIQSGADADSGLDRVFHVYTGTQMFELNDVTVRYGRILSAVTTTGSEDGAGLFNETDATVTISSTTFSQNSIEKVDEDGGAIGNIGGGTIWLTNSSILNNQAEGGLGSSGGGLFNAFGSEIIVHNSVISGNVASSKGGGVYSNRDGATILISNSTIANNHAGILGGGVQNGATLVMTNTTVSGNTSDEDGGGISNDSEESQFTGSHLTIAGNSADANNDQSGEGGGLWLEAIAMVSLRNSIVADSNSGGDCANQGGTFTDGGYNLIEDGSCITAGTSLT